jgi:hypothetical protein
MKPENLNGICLGSFEELMQAYTQILDIAGFTQQLDHTLFSEKKLIADAILPEENVTLQYSRIEVVESLCT